MLDYAKKHEDQLKKLYIETIGLEQNKYYDFSSYVDFDLNIKTDTWSSLQKVSILSNQVKDPVILGYFRVSISRPGNDANQLQIISFYNSDYSVYASIFRRDLAQFIEDLFYFYNVYKLSYSVAIGNPVEKVYDIMTQRVGGSIVGIKENDVILRDGLRYSTKLYEILKRDYDNTYIKRLLK